jgi:tetratricopeptide (TPR) repeat protein
VLRACFLALFATAVGVTSAHAEPDRRQQGRAHYELGLERYRAQDYTRAIAEFEKAYALDPRSEILFAWGQSERLRGDCAAARAIYERVLALPLSPDEGAATRAAMERCQPAPLRPAPAAVAPGPLAAAPVATGPAAAPVLAAGATTTAAPTWRTDVVGHLLTAGGAVLVAAAGGLYFKSRVDENGARDALDYEQHVRLTDRA